MTHQRNSFRSVFLCFLAAVAVASCGSKESPQSAADSAPLRAEDLAYKNIVIEEVTAAPDIEEADGPKGTFQMALMTYLRGKNAFDSVEFGTAAPAEKPSLVVKANIVEMRIVSGSARFWGGVMAGSSYMNLQVKLQDSATGQVLADELVSSANNSMGAAWSGGSTDRSLPSDMGEIVGNFVIAKAKKQ